MKESDVFLVFVDGKPGHEESYARWFRGEHMADIRALPGVTRAFAGKLAALDGKAPPAQLCGYYETPDCGDLLATIAEARWSGGCWKPLRRKVRQRLPTSPPGF